MTATRYEPALAGGAIALVAGPRALLLPSGIDDERRGALFAALAGAGVQSALDLLAAGGLALVPPFALLDGSAPERLHVVVRGGFSATVTTGSSEERVSGEAVSTWVERVFPGAAAVAVAVEGATAHRDELPIADGAVLAASVRMTLLGAPAEPAGTAPVAPVAAAAPAAAPAPDGIAGSPTVTDVEATMVELPVPQPEPDSAPGRAPGEADHSGDSEGYDYLFGETLFRGVAEAAVRVEEPEEAAEHAGPDAAASEPDEVDPFTTGGDHDGQTVLTGAIAKLRAGRAATTASEEAAPPPPPAAPSIVLVFSTGSREDLTQPVLVGRSPSVTKVPGNRVPRLVTVGGVDQDISRNHAQFALEGGTVVVTDLHSRNGTMIAMPGREPQKLRAGEPTSVLVGTVVDLGSGITITVEGE